MALTRSSGVLLPLNSLPGDYGIGTIGRSAYLFVDFLSRASQNYWQICPFGHVGKENSPYICFSAFAGNPYLIDLEGLVQEGYLARKELKKLKRDVDQVGDYEKLKRVVDHLLEKAYRAFKQNESLKKMLEMKRFERANRYWLSDYALYMALRAYLKNDDWSTWPDKIKLRDQKTLRDLCDRLHFEIGKHKFIQYIFFKQWAALKKYANRKGVKIVGDIPIFLSYQSADVWSQNKQFLLDNNLRPTHVAGVPPDYFSKNGQLWGNPLYDWDYMKKNKYGWWIMVFTHLTRNFDLTRIDHFRGFCAYWKIKYPAQNAMNGKWTRVPGRDFFDLLKKKLKNFNFIAEDLGVITQDVIDLKNHLHLPGMKILQFAFDSKEKEQVLLPFAYEKDFVAYTGTHDNDTTRGWFEKLGKKDQKLVLEYLASDGKDIVWAMIRETLRSPCVLSILPVWDLLELGSRARINTPGRFENIYQWKLTHKSFKKLSGPVAAKLKKLTQLYGRG